MVFKLIGLGLKGYFRDNFNTFDCFIVFVSIVDFVFNMAKPLKDKFSGGGAIMAFRAFRLLRVFKLA
jgi:hypothetical protein